MRVSIHIDSANTEQVRHLAVLLHRAGLTGQLEVGLDGPEKWNARTPKMSAAQYTSVIDGLATTAKVAQRLAGCDQCEGGKYTDDNGRCPHCGLDNAVK